MGRGKRGPEPSLRSQWLGQYLRELRLDGDITLEQAGDYLQRDGSMVARYERAEYPIRRGDVLALINLYGVSDPSMRDALLQLSEDVWRKGWWDPYAEDLGRTFFDHPWIEARSAQAKIYAPMVIPGLLQAPEYAATLIRDAEPNGSDSAQIGRWIEVRLGRQQVLHKDPPLRLSVVLEEWVLRRPVGGRGVLRHQLGHLLHMAKHSAIDVRVMPADHGNHAGDLGEFEYFEMPEPYPAVAHVETLAGGLYIEQPHVERFKVAYDSLHAKALGPRKSTSLIARIAEEI